MLYFGNGMKTEIDINLKFKIMPEHPPAPPIPPDPPDGTQKSYIKAVLKLDMPDNEKLKLFNKWVE
jgi:hypothetical protein